MTPTGMVLVGVFLVIWAIALYADKNASKKFLNQINEQYRAKNSFENIFVTNNGELLYYLPSGTLGGYKKWNLSDIAYVGSQKGSFTIYDANKKGMRGEYLTPSKKKALKEKAYVSFDVGSNKVQQYVDFIKDQAPHIQYFNN